MTTVTWVCATCGNHFGDPRPEVCVVCADERQWVPPGGQRVTFVWSAPNRLPLSEAVVRGVAAAVLPFAFDRIYGGWWVPVLRSGAKDTVRRSAERYIQHLRGTA
jgi:hypothetical protein